MKNDYWDNMIHGLPYGLYFYFIDSTNILQVSSILGNCPAIQSILFTPYFEAGDFQIDEVKYDAKRFGNIDKWRPSVPNAPTLKRIGTSKVGSKLVELKTIKAYKIENTSIGGYRDWRNESKLYNYPYSYGLLCDYINTPLLIKYHLVNNVFYNNQLTFQIKKSLSDKCTYSLSCKGYKGDDTGQIEGAISSASLDLPCSSSAYNQFMATSKAQFMTANQLASETNQMNGMFNTMNLFSNLLGSAMSMNILGAINSGVNYYQAQKKNDFDYYAKMQNQNAQIQDLKSSPRSVSTMGGDVPFSVVNSQKQVEFLRYRGTEEMMDRIGTFFAMYGYKQNKLMRVNLRSRHYYNFIKCVQANVSGENVPKEDLEVLKTIYERGVTIWHMDRENVEPLDYTYDNYEVK